MTTIANAAGEGNPVPDEVKQFTFNWYLEHRLDKEKKGGNPESENAKTLLGYLQRNGIGRGRTNFPSRGKRLDILRKAAKGIGPTLKRRGGWS